MKAKRTETFHRPGTECELLEEAAPTTAPEQFGEAPESSQAVPSMPDLISPQFGFCHTVDSALASLSRAGVSSDRITINKAGRGWLKDRVVEQQPPAGSLLTPDAAINLAVEGDGFLYHLPTGMRESGKEGEIGTEEFTSLFDDAIEKAAYYVRQGGFYFDLRPENRTGCARWIRLFGIAPEAWPVDRWYRLAVVLPCLHHMAGREVGLRLAMKVLLDLDVAAITRRARWTRLDPDEVSLFGQRATRLGADLVISDGMEDEMSLEVTLGPVSLDDYREHIQEDERRIRQVLDLTLPYHLSYSVGWLVGDSSSAPRLGIDQQNSVLGVNTHLGQN